MIKKTRLIGLDLFRGVAVYAVIVLHSDETVSISPWGWPFILEFSKFAVPFFLAAAFYLNFQKIYSQPATPFPLASRSLRLLIPYGIWSLVYLLYKAAKYILEGDASKISSLFQDPFSIIFTGGAAFHLYFLPLLVAGSILVKVMYPLAHRQIRVWQISLVCLLSLITYQWLLSSGNEFNNGQGSAFLGLFDIMLSDPLDVNPLFRAVAVFVAWLVRCWPYVSIAMLLNHPFIVEKLSEFKGNYLVITIILFFLINSLGSYVLPKAIYEVGRGYITLALSILLSKKLRHQSWIQSLSDCSFGIYLMHLLFVESVYIILARLLPSWNSMVSIQSLLLIAFLVLILSWSITYFLRLNPRISRVLFGA